MKKIVIISFILSTFFGVSTAVAAEDCVDGVQRIVATSWETDTTQFLETVTESEGFNAAECVSVEVRNAGQWAWSMTKALTDPEILFTGSFEGFAALQSDASLGLYDGELPLIAAVYGNSTFTLISSTDSPEDLLGKIIVTGRCGDNWNAPGDPVGIGSPNVGTLMIVDYVRRELGADVPIECSDDILGRDDLRSDTIYIHDGGSPKKRATGLFEGTYIAAAVLVEEQFSIMAKKPDAFTVLVAPGAFAQLPVSGVFVMPSVWGESQDLICRHVRALANAQARFHADDVWAEAIFAKMVDYNPEENYLFQRLTLVNNDGSPNVAARIQAIGDLTAMAKDLIYPEIAPTEATLDDFYHLYNISEENVPQSEIYVGDVCFNDS